LFSVINSVISLSLAMQSHSTNLKTLQTHHTRRWSNFAMPHVKGKS
jgi:hypothetical protein